jgi:hypothetical protein
MKEIEKGKKEEVRQVIIEAPKFETAKVTIVGDTKLVQHKFSQKARQMIMDKQKLGSVANKGKKKEPRDFDEMYRGALYTATEGWNGVPAISFRKALVSACRVCGYQMTKGKLALFCEADGFDAEGTPLVKITKGEPHKHEGYGRIADGGIDVNIRPMWDEGWEAVVRIRYDADMFSQKDVINLLARAGMQVGIGEGRPDSKDSCGCGWGTFRIK